MLAEPDGGWELGAGEVLQVGTWLELSKEAFEAFEPQPGLLVYSLSVSYPSNGVATTFTIEGSPAMKDSPEGLSEYLNIKKREWKP